MLTVGILAVISMIYVQFIVVITNENAEYIWGVFIFLAGLCSVMLIITISMNTFWISQNLQQIGKMTHSFKLKDAFQKINGVIIGVLIIQSTISIMSVLIGSPSISHFMNNHAGYVLYGQFL